ncbi:SDR family NAD(P)-dependent oxidoreductase [Paenibacillus gansuensis]|uniref:SDR family NAD(P)-dependent oxidoreductase n=1 Tax=Paenibacillus gansuensis TaxID=306542 RepID=A0ABW5P6R2_9BACL
MVDLHNKIVVITGASSGIGAETAREFSRQGAVPILTARSVDQLHEVAGKLEGRFGVFRLDVTKEDEVRDVFALIEQKFGPIDVLVNNAGFGFFETVLDAPVHHMEDMMNVNYMGTVRCVKNVLPGMTARRSGHIVNVASLAGKVATAKAAGYAATKHAVLGFSNGLRQEMKGTGVRITTINPGPVATPFLTKADPEGGYFDNVKGLILTPEQVAAAIVNSVKRGKEEVNLPSAAGFALRFYHLFPRWIDRVGHRLLNRK